MNKDKQIEEMAKDFCALSMPCEDCHLYKNGCHAKKYATRAYTAGYRKSTNDASIIAEELLEMAECYGAGVLFWKKVKQFAIELKKNCTENKNENT